MTDVRTFPTFDGDGGSSPVTVYFKDTRCSGDVEEALWKEMEHLRAQLAIERSERAALADRVQRLELCRVAETAED